jgi:hypothetical protein
MTVTDGLFQHVLPLVEGIEARLEAGIEVMDAGCGQGSRCGRAASTLCRTVGRARGPAPGRA